MIVREDDLPSTLAGIKGICFDCFGTLFEINDKRKPYRRLMAALPEAKRSEFRHRIMREAQKTVDWPAALGVKIDKETMERVEADIACEVSSIRFRPLMKPILENLRHHKISLQVCSNSASPYYPKIIEELPHDFGPVIMSYAVGLLKPEPAMYELVERYLKLPADQVLFVGDTQAADIGGPKNAGMKSMHVDAFVDLFRNDEVKRRQAASLKTPYGQIQGAEVVEGIVVDPVYPPPMVNPHRRNWTEYLTWKDRPYILSTPVGFEVWCFERRAPFGPKMWGSVCDLQEAISLAQSPSPESPPDEQFDPELDF